MEMAAASPAREQMRRSKPSVARRPWRMAAARIRASTVALFIGYAAGQGALSAVLVRMFPGAV